GLLAQFGKAVPLDETPRGGRRRLGRLGETVPAPEVPFPRDEPLSGLQKRAEPLAFLASDDADLLQTPLQRRRRLNEIAQPLRPRGQRDVSSVVRQRPMGGRRRIGRCVEIVAERRAERSLKTLGDNDLVDDGRPEIARAGVEEFFQRARLGVEPLGARFRGRERRAAGRLRLARLMVARSGRFRRLVRRLRLLARQLEARLEPRQILSAAALRGDQREFRVEPGELRLETREAAPLLLDRRLKAFRARVDRGEAVLRLMQLVLRHGERRLDRGQARSRLLLAFAARGLGLQELGPLLLEALRDFRRVLDQRALALEVAGELLDAAGELGDAFVGALLLGVERVAGDDEPVQRRARLRFLFAKRRQLMRGQRLLARRGGLLDQALIDERRIRREFALGLGEPRGRGAMRDERRERLVLADLRGDGAIARRPPRLAAQALDLAVDLLQHVVETQQIFRG